MSIQSEITRISGNVADALDAITAKGVTVPVGSSSDDLADLISQISGGGAGAFVHTVEQLPGGGDHHIITGVDISDTTAVAADVAQGKYFYTAEGTKTAGTASGGGGSSFALLYSTELTISTTSTSSTEVTTLNTGATFELGKTYMVSIQDKAGERNGYFYRCDSRFFIPASTFANSTAVAHMGRSMDANGARRFFTTGYGVFLYRYYGGNNMGNIVINSRYSDTTSYTIDGTYTIKLYEEVLP